MKTGFEAVIFDMDGVIFDTERVYLECCQQAADALGIGDVGELCEKCIGLNDEKTRQMYREFFSDDAKEKEFNDTARAIVRKRLDIEIPLKSGAREILSFLYQSGIPVALASSTKTETVIKELIKTDLFGYFTRISGGDSVKHSKPHPDIFLRTAELLGVNPEKCLVIEDSFNGVRAASAAGMKCIMVPDLVQPDDETRNMTEMVVPSLTDLKELFEAGKI